jgi:hypothetical protein
VPKAQSLVRRPREFALQQCGPTPPAFSGHRPGKVCATATATVPHPTTHSEPPSMKSLGDLRGDRRTLALPRSGRFASPSTDLRLPQGHWDIDAISAPTRTGSSSQHPLGSVFQFPSAARRSAHTLPHHISTFPHFHISTFPHSPSSPFFQGSGPLNSSLICNPTSRGHSRWQ